MKRLLAFLALVCVCPLAHAQLVQHPIDCATNVECINGGPANTGTGDQAPAFASKVNQDMAAVIAAINSAPTAIPISVYTQAGAQAACATDVSTYVNALVTAGSKNILIPAGCKYFPTGGVTPAGVTIVGEDARSSTIQVASPGTTNLFVGPYGRIQNIGVVDEFCQVSASPQNVAKTCPIGQFYNQSSTNANLAAWVGQGWISSCGPTYTTPDGGASVATDTPCMSITQYAVASDGLFAATANASGSGTSAIRVETAGQNDYGIQLINGVNSPSTEHTGIEINEYSNNTNTTNGPSVAINRIGDSTGVTPSIYVTDQSANSALNASPLFTATLVNQASGNLFNLYQSTTPFSGNGFVMNFGNASGTFSGYFAQFVNNSTTEFQLTSGGSLFANGGVNNTPIGNSTPAAGTFTTLNASGQTQLHSGSGNIVFQLIPGATTATGESQLYNSSFAEEWAYGIDTSANAYQFYIADKTASHNDLTIQPNGAMALMPNGGKLNLNGVTGASSASKYVCEDSSGNVLTGSGCATAGAFTTLGNPTAASATPTSVNLILVPCTGTASTDSTLLQAAFTQANTNSGGVVQLAANCTISATQTVYSNTYFNGAGYTVTGAINTAWSGSTVAHFFSANTSATNITVANTSFVAPATATGSVHILQFFGTNSHISILNNYFNANNAAGDCEATPNATDVKVIGNTCLAASNACYDNWQAAEDVDISDNYCSTWTTGGAGTAAYGILWTGFNTADSAGSLTTHAKIHDNTIYIANQPTFGDIGIWLQGYSSCTGAAADFADVHDNEIFFASGIWGGAIKADGCANHGYIHDNVIYSDGTASSAPAIEAKSTATDIHIDHNHAYNFNNTASSPDAGVFNNASTSGTLLDNTCYGGSCSVPLTSGQIAGSATEQPYTKPYNLATWGVPAGIISSVTMGANGAFTGATSLPTTFSQGIWAYWPANSICSSGQASAGVYWTVMSSATAGTVFNNTLTTGVPTIPASTTAFSCSAGSGTQTTAGLRALITLPIPAHTMGANGNLYIKTLGARTNNADTVIQEWSFGGNNFALASTVSVNWYGMERTILNNGSESIQAAMGATTGGTDAVLAGNGSSNLAVNTASSANLLFQCQINTATDWCVIYGGMVQANYAP